MLTWHSVEDADRPIEYAEPVLIGRRTGNAPAVLPGFWDGKRFKAAGLYGIIEFKDPTHWARLPGPETIG